MRPTGLCAGGREAPEWWRKPWRRASTLGYALDLTDLRLPHTWYPLARSIQRKVVIHVGPTNSGKTYNALQRLQESASGLYCGPLRLLAWEIAERINSNGVPCSLLTGQERRRLPEAQHTSMTVEMADLSREFDCAVIDEIQMMGSAERGSSFTRALLGLAAKELHVCGEEAAAALAQQLLEHTEDTVEVKHYDRLSPLLALDKPLGKYSRVRKGDCIVAFSRREIYSIKREIEQSTNWRCCVIYGSLPPETRTRQAAQFNSPQSGYDVLVASDAVGMGLNLNIRRVVFSALQKFDGKMFRPLKDAEVKQIAGRAGRYMSQFPNGEVTCLHAADLPQLHSSLSASPARIKEAGLFPSFDQLALYSSQFPRKTFPELLEAFVSSARLSPSFFIRDCEDMLKVAALLEHQPRLSLSDRFLFCQSPVDVDDPKAMGALLQFSCQYEKYRIVRLSRKLTPGTVRIPSSPRDLAELESWHKILDLYLWLGLRLEDAFTDSHVAESERQLCSLLIEQGLRAMEVSKEDFSSTSFFSTMSTAERVQKNRARRQLGRGGAEKGEAASEKCDRGGVGGDV